VTHASRACASFLADACSTLIRMRLIGYIRVSRVAGREGESFISPDVQRERVSAMAAAKGHTIVDWEQDFDQSGGKYARPGLQAALEAVEAGAADGIAVARLNRFARSVADAARALERLERTSGALVAVDLDLDTTTSSGRLMRTVLMALAEFELEQAQENWAIAGSHAAARGIHVCNVAPAGYRKTADKRLEPDPVAARIVREVFRRRGAGESWVSLCRLLDENLPRANGKHWVKSTVADMIKRRTYLGEARGGGTVNPDAHPPIVTRAEFEAAQASDADGRRERGSDGGALLAGIIRCATCGNTLTRVSDGRRGYTNYKCRKRNGNGVCKAGTGISTKRADAFVESEFLAAIEREPVAARGKPADGSLEQATAALEAAERELSEFQSANLISVMGREAFVEGVTVRQAAVDEARRRLGEVSAGSPLEGIRDLRKVWPTLEGRERRQLLASVLERVDVSPAPGAGRGAAVEDRLELVWR
jgi:DNA invertase Pin-like site-specific DNA recombinase